MRTGRHGDRSHLPLTSPEFRTGFFTLLGLDPLAKAPFRAYFRGKQPSLEIFSTLLTTPSAVLLSEDMAAQAGLSPCAPAAISETCRLRLVIAGREYPAFLVGLLRPQRLTRVLKWYLGRFLLPVYRIYQR